MKKKKFVKWVILFPFMLSLLLGCGGKGKSVKTIEGDPETLYKQGLVRFNKRDYSEALKLFEQLKSIFPDSPPYTIWAELKAGDCHFLKKDYVEAIAAYEEFKKIHPAHEEIPYVQYQIGMAYFNQIRTLDRDQTPTRKALSNFEYLIANYPSGLFTEKAKDKVGVLRKRLADHEFYIGNFYYKQGKFQASAARFEGLLEKFPKNSEEDKILFLLGKSYVELGQGEKAREVLSRIVAEYPKSSYAKESKAILDQGIKEKKVSLRKTKTGEPRKGETGELELDRIALVKFEEEKRQPVSLTERKKAIPPEKPEEKAAPLPVTSEPVKAIPPKEETKKPVPPLEDPMKEDRVQPVPPPKEAKRLVPPPPPKDPMHEDRTRAIAPPASPETTPEKEIKPQGEKRVAALPIPQAAPLGEREKPGKGAPAEPGQVKLVDSREPIDITSDRVETYRKENLIVFKGNVMARQKDMVIYADSLEALIIEDGKGIEKVIAGGNVKIQQGLRVANCQKAIFYNADQKLILTGDPKVWEGDNMISGDEIVFDIEQNRVEVKGGAGGRGKVKVDPGGKFEKPK